MMPHERCSEVLRNPCALTLGDEPLAGAVEHGPMQLWMSLPEFCIPLHNPVHVLEAAALIGSAVVHALFAKARSLDVNAA